MTGNASTPGGQETGFEADYRELAVEILATHAQQPDALWNGYRDLLDAAKLALTALESSAPKGMISGTADLLAGIARLLDNGPFPAVSLHAASRGSFLPTELRPGQLLGPPEEDVLLHALALAAPPGSRPWPHGQVDAARLATAVQALTAVVRCRMVPLRAAALRFLLTQVPSADDHLKRGLLRRAVWLIDPRCDNPPALLLALTGPEVPLVASLPTGLRVTPAPDNPPAFARSDWASWQSTQGPVRLSGRIHALRRHSRLAFADLRWDGQAAQIALENHLSAQLHVGDLLTVRGNNGVSRTGQPTVFADEVEFHQSGTLPSSGGRGADDVLGNVRRLLAADDFVEAITPVLTDGYFGGSALPFITWAAAAGRSQYLRVTTELDLLKVVAAGTSRCYEIGPSFRNEGLRGQAAKEFLMLEAYASDLDLEGMAEHAVRLVRAVTAYPTPVYTTTFDQAFQELSGVDPHHAADVGHLAKELVPATAARTDDPDVLVRRLWRSNIRARLPGLALITSIPGASSPLIAGSGRDAQRIWLYADGTEIAEISQNERDPAALAEQFRQQFADDPHPVHRDYRAVISMFEGGVPPCVGLGLSIPRLTALARLHAHDIPEDSRSPHDASSKSGL